MSQLLEYVGTRWYKCDLHLHTPASECFQDQTVTPEQWVDRAIEQGLDCVAVTDHNTNAWVDAIIDAAIDKPLTVFPGVEITCDTSKVHILVLFDPSKNAQDVYDFLIKCDVARTSFAKQDAHTEKSALDVAEIAYQSGGLVIPAHIDEYSGLDFSNDILDGFYRRDYINAVQVVHKPFLDPTLSVRGNDVLKNEINTLRGNPTPELSEDIIKNWHKPVKLALDHDIAITTFSDNPHAPLNTKHGLAGIGSRYTLIKMGETPNLEGLRQAFLLPNFRVWNDFEVDPIPYVQPELWIKSIKIKNTIVSGKTDPLLINFNPQSNSIIGGRGSGKSSILRFLRGVFNRTEDLGELDEILKDHQEFYQIYDAQTKKGALLEDSSIEVEFIRRKVLHLIKAEIVDNHGTQNVSISKYDTENEEWEEIEEPDEFINFFEYEHYSQKQIYEIAQEPNSLKERIDSSIEDIDQLQQNLTVKENEYLEVATGIRTIESQIANKTKLKTDIKDLEDQIESFKKSGLSDLIENNQNYLTGQSKISGLDEQMVEQENSLQEFIDDFGIEAIELSELGDEEKAELDTLVKEAVDEYGSLNKQLVALKVKAEEIRTTYNTKIAATVWDKARLKNEKDLEDEKEKRIEEGIDDLEKFDEISAAKITKEGELAEIVELEVKLTIERAKLVTLKADHLSIVKQITAKRNEYVQEYMQKDRVKVKISSFRNKNHFEDRLRDLLQRPTGFEAGIKALSDLCFTGNAEQKIIEVKDVFKKIRVNADIEAIVDGHFVNLVKGLTPEQMDRLELFYPDDEIKVEYKPNDVGGWKSLEAASAGQKTTAILTLILLDGDTPLILDQPEDDLDNRLVYQLIVDRLKEAKKKRQIIVVTHNANIPVNGDSEYIISMDSESKYIKVLHEGTVESPEIKKEICDVMEGTKEAFEMRSKRYMHNEAS